MEYYQEIKWHEHAHHITNTQKNIYLTSGKRWKLQIIKL